MKKTITIGITDDERCAISISPDVTCTEAFQLLGTLATHILSAYYQASVACITEDELKGKRRAEQEIAAKGIKDSLYDAADTLFSNVLHDFQPEHPRYSLEDEAIIELVNKKIELQYNALSSEQRSQYAQAYQKLRLNAQFKANMKGNQAHGTNDSQGSTSEETPASGTTD